MDPWREGDFHLTHIVGLSTAEALQLANRKVPWKITQISGAHRSIQDKIAKAKDWHSFGISL